MRRALAAAALVFLMSGCASLRSRYQDPLSVDEHMRLGASYEDQGERVAAGREYAAALRKESGHLPALMALGNLAFQGGDLIEAEIYYRKVLSLVPEHAGANNNLAMVFLVRNSRLEVAESHAKKALERAGPFRPYVLDTLANVYMKQGRYPEARVALDEAEHLCEKSDLLLRQHLTQSRRQLDVYSRAL